MYSEGNYLQKEMKNLENFSTHFFVLESKYIKFSLGIV